MIKYGHGGDIETAKAYYSGEILDFSANINPLGMPEGVARAARESIGDAVHYPDPHCRHLRQAIAEKEGIEARNILCGNGAADLIFRLAQALKPNRAVVLAPTFSEYESALRSAGCEVVYHLLRRENDFDVTDALLGQLTPDIDLLWLCTPNNPSGRLIGDAMMGRILEHCAKMDIFVAVDECFLDLCTQGKPLTDRIRSFPRLFLLRAFTKSFAMPGLRLGYGLCGDPDLLDRMAASGPPWAVSVPALAAGLAALREDDFLESSRAYIAEERQWLTAALRSLGFWVCEGSANYLLLRSDSPRDLGDAAQARGILIRRCSNYVGLDEHDYRVAVRRHEENQRLIQVLAQCLQEKA